MRRLHLPAAALVGACTLAACGSSTPSSSPTTATGHGGGAPAVSRAGDLKGEPLPGAGTPPAPTHLVKKDLVVGTGAEATASSTVQVQYVGTAYRTGKVFDSSWQRGQPATFSLNGVIPGFSQGIVGMKVGGRRLLVLPPSLAYGSAGSPPAVTPNETLVFVVDLLAVR